MCVPVGACCLLGRTFPLCQGRCRLTSDPDPCPRRPPPGPTGEGEDVRPRSSRSAVSLATKLSGNRGQATTTLTQGGVHGSSCIGSYGEYRVEFVPRIRCTPEKRHCSSASPQGAAYSRHAAALARSPRDRFHSSACPTPLRSFDKFGKHRTVSTRPSGETRACATLRHWLDYPWPPREILWTVSLRASSLSSSQYWHPHDLQMLGFSGLAPRWFGSCRSARTGPPHPRHRNATLLPYGSESIGCSSSSKHLKSRTSIIEPPITSSSRHRTAKP